MKNKVSAGSVSSFTNTSEATIKGGDLCSIGTGANAYVGVAVKDILAGETGIIDMHGIFTFTKASGAIAQGAALYVGSGNVQVATTGSIYVGRCELATSGTEVDVRINFLPVATAASS